MRIGILVYFSLAIIFFGICQHLIELPIACGLEFAVVDLHAVIQVQLDAAQGEVGDHLVIVAALLELLLELSFRLVEAATSRAFWLWSIISSTHSFL